jgi:hypothetical protein
MTITDTYTQAQADAKFFQTANAFVAGKNKIINGDFGVNQRSFTSTTTTDTFGFDRFSFNFVGGTTTYSAETFTLGSAPVVGYEARNFARLVTTSQTATGDRAILVHRIEDVRTFANQTATFSFWAKAASGTPQVALELVQGFGTGGSPSPSVTGISPTKVTLTTSWARYSVTIAVPSISGKTIGTDLNSNGNLQLTFWVSAGSNFDVRSNTLGLQNNTFDFWGIQAEAGSIATPFQTATGTKQGELAACQRYYYRKSATAAYTRFADGIGTSTTGGACKAASTVTMRTGPSAIDYSALGFYDGTNLLAITSAVVSNTGLDTLGFDIAVAASGVQYRPYQIIANNNANAYLCFNAEL